uniref:Glutathione S-transferase n=1 Tax=Strombidinopsis acuminata TaxID=141414 RepID=A0A7S3RIV8_9SPIT|mmetsp:Transcript_110311/g.152551  ORF Transcript_110311/g.152551 Transcript_110311/m.152551 type:complete len:203 (+) Transcript_110311:39-647(+)
MSYKVYYFDAYGRAEAIRMMFIHAKVEFEDIRLTREQFAELKAAGKFEFGQVPAIETPEGKVLVQSGAINRYVGTKLGYLPSDPLAAYEVDNLCDAINDMYMKLFQSYFGPSEEAKAAAYKAFVETSLPFFLGKFEARLAGQKYFGGENPNVFDFCFGGFLQQPNVPKFQDVVDKFPGIKAHQDNWALVFADHLASRPKCNM